MNCFTFKKSFLFLNSSVFISGIGFVSAFLNLQDSEHTDPDIVRVMPLLTRSSTRLPALDQKQISILVTCSKILQGHLRTTGKNIWISVVLAVILAGAGALFDLGSKGNFISLSPVCISTFKLFMFFCSFYLKWYKVPEPGGTHCKKVSPSVQPAVRYYQI